MSDDRSDLEEAVRLLRALKTVGCGAHEIVFAAPPDVANDRTAFLARHPEKPKLLGCPFCGGVPELSTPQKGYGSMRRGYCHNCQVYGPWGTDTADATAAWNRRAPASRFESVDGVQSINIEIVAPPVGDLRKDKQ